MENPSPSQSRERCQQEIYRGRFRQLFSTPRLAFTSLPNRVKSRISLNEMQVDFNKRHGMSANLFVASLRIAKPTPTRAPLGTP